MNKKNSNVTIGLDIAILVVGIIKLICLIAFEFLILFEVLSGLVMLVLGIILIVFHKTGKNKGLNLANGIVAIIPFVNFVSIILSILALAIKDKSVEEKTDDPMDVELKKLESDNNVN